MQMRVIEMLKLKEQDIEPCLIVERGGLNRWLSLEDCRNRSAKSAAILGTPASSLEKSGCIRGVNERGRNKVR